MINRFWRFLPTSFQTVCCHLELILIRLILFFQHVIVFVFFANMFYFRLKVPWDIIYFLFPTTSQDFRRRGFRFRRVRKTGISDNLPEERPDDDPALWDRRARPVGASQP